MAPAAGRRCSRRSNRRTRPGLGERVELRAVEGLTSCAGVEGLDEAILPRRARVDVEGLDAAQGEAVADGPGNELRAVVGACEWWSGLIPCPSIRFDDSLDSALHDLGGHPDTIDPTFKGFR